MEILPSPCLILLLFSQVIWPKALSEISIPFKKIFLIVEKNKTKIRDKIILTFVLYYFFIKVILKD